METMPQRGPVLRFPVIRAYRGTQRLLIFAGVVCIISFFLHFSLQSGVVSDCGCGSTDSSSALSDVAGAAFGVFGTLYIIFLGYALIQRAMVPRFKKAVIPWASERYGLDFTKVALPRLVLRSKQRNPKIAGWHTSPINYPAPGSGKLALTRMRGHWLLVDWLTGIEVGTPAQRRDALAVRQVAPNSLEALALHVEKYQGVWVALPEREAGGKLEAVGLMRKTKLPAVWSEMPSADLLRQLYGRPMISAALFPTQLQSLLQVWRRTGSMVAINPGAHGGYLVDEGVRLQTFLAPLLRRNANDAMPRLLRATRFDGPYNSIWVEEVRYSFSTGSSDESILQRIVLDRPDDVGDLPAYRDFGAEDFQLVSRYASLQELRGWLESQLEDPESSEDKAAVYSLLQIMYPLLRGDRIYRLPVPAPGRDDDYRDGTWVGHEFVVIDRARGIVRWLTAGS